MMKTNAWVVSTCETRAEDCKYPMNWSLAKSIGIALAVLHIIFFVLFSIDMNFGFQDAMSGMLWGIWRPVDFPVSLAAFYGFVPAPLEWNVTTALKFIYPYVVHGIVGTAWWFLIPVLIGAMFGKISRASKPQA